MLSTRTNTFLYFGFGSNLLAGRIHTNNPSAIRRGIGKLENYRLDFGYWSERWKGSVATIVPDNGYHVWGAIWELNKEDEPNLDRQEGVDKKIYEVIFVNVLTPSGDVIKCRCYQLCRLPEKIPDGEARPEKCRPSLIYTNVIIRGAVESGLPEEYISELKKIQHNGRTDSTIMSIMLN